MGGKSTKQTSNSTSNQTTTPTVAPWMQGGFQDLFSKIGEFGNVDPSTLVSGPSALQQQAFGMAGQIGAGQGAGSGLFGNAANLIQGAGTAGANTATGAQVGPVTSAGAAGLMDAGLDQYLNPYTSNVTDAYSADFDENAGKARAAQSAQAALNGAFGGSRYGIREAQTEGELGRARASGLASILQGGFDRATSLADSDAGRRQSANLANAAASNQAMLAQAGFNQQTGMFNAGQQDAALARALQAGGMLSNIGTAQGANERENIGLLAGLGGQQRDIDQAGRTAGLSQLQALAQLYGSFPSQLFTSQNTSGTSSGSQTNKENPGLLGSIGQGAQTAASLAALFSDERLKENIQPIGDGWYAYNYIWSPEPQIGVMAQEVLEYNPEAVHTGPGGFLAVDYGAL